MTTNFRLCLCTWNVGEADPPGSFTSLLGLANEDLPGLYAIGLQELKSTMKSMTYDSIFDDQWTVDITQVLSQKKYIRIASLRLMGIHLAVFVLPKYLKHITNIETQHTRTGLGGTWGNKGGVSIRFEICGVQICIVNCHFAAHQNQVAERIEDYRAIVESQIFQGEESLIILDHDYVFWMGDLNFRLDDLSNEEVKRRISKKDYESMWPHDQLKKVMKEEVILLDFEEGPLLFPPTYKYDYGTDTYDTSPKQRKPAWCDRILWMCHEDTFEDVSLSVQQHSYTSHDEYRVSDHKPIVSNFTIKVPKNPPPVQVEFESVADWSYWGNGNFTYITAADYQPSPWDWIAIYKLGFKYFQEYVTYIWVPKTYYVKLEDGRKRWRVYVDKSYVQECVGRHILVYHSNQKRSIIGSSKSFKVLGYDDVDGTDESESSDSESDVNVPDSSDSDGHDVPHRRNVPGSDSRDVPHSKNVSDSDSHDVPHSRNVPDSYGRDVPHSRNVPNSDSHDIPHSKNVLLPHKNPETSESEMEEDDTKDAEAIEDQQELTDRLKKIQLKRHEDAGDQVNTGDQINTGDQVTLIKDNERESASFSKEEAPEGGYGASGGGYGASGGGYRASGGGYGTSGGGYGARMDNTDGGTMKEQSHDITECDGMKEQSHNNITDGDTMKEQSHNATDSGTMKEQSHDNTDGGTMKEQSHNATDSGTMKEQSHDNIADGGTMKEQSHDNITDGGSMKEQSHEN